MLLDQIVDRVAEARELRALSEVAAPRLALLYGRRQVGKTFLLSALWNTSDVFYFLAANVTPELNRQDLLVELGRWSHQALHPADYPTWRTAFRELLSGIAPRVVILDEFQYLLSGNDDVASQLVAIWDREMTATSTTLILCGSELSTMEQLQHSGSPLYGRINWSARLGQFDYLDASKMLPGRSPREAAIAYGLFGGMPRYLAAIGTTESVNDAATRALVSPRGEVHGQLATLIEQESSIREPSTIRAVLAAVASGRTAINELAQAVGLAQQPYIVRRALEILEHLDIVARERNFSSTRRTPYRHVIVDNAVLTWHRFILPNRSRLSQGDPAEVWKERVEPHLNDHMGRIFERMVAQAFTRLHDVWGLAGSQEWSRWEGRDRNRRSIEIDVVARLDDGRMLTGEIKWTTQPRGFEMHNTLQRNLEDLAASGFGWAKEALDGPRVYVSAGGFTDETRAWASSQQNVRLLELDDLYINR